MRAAVSLLVISLCGTAAANAQQWRDDHDFLLIRQDESAGHNVPNFRYDGKHTAGGYWQITDTNWRTFAPQLDIDLNKWPNAGSAPEELQGQVGFLMKARLGLLPWVPYNQQLRRHLKLADSVVAKRIDSPIPRPVAATESARHDWNVFPDEDETPSVAPPAMQEIATDIPPPEGQN